MIGSAPSLALPHHDGSSLYVSNDAPPLGGTFRVRLRVPHASTAAEVHVRTVIDGEPDFVAATLTQRDDVESWWEAELSVYHRRTHYRFLLLGGQVGYLWLTATGVFDHDVPDREDFSVVSHSRPPSWLPDTVVYQVFPDRFARSGTTQDQPLWAIGADWDAPIDEDWRRSVRQVFGGDLPGLTARLDHLSDLGVNAVYLTPFFPSESSHRYDATTFDHVDPLLGGDEALVELVDAAHQRGIRVIGDLTTNHSGRRHDWFQTAQRDADAPEASFYTFRDHPDDYVAWLDVPSLPKFDHRSPQLRDRMITSDHSVVRRWLEPPFGLDGWRIDVANMTGRLGEVDVNHDVARSIRTTMDTVGGDRWLVAEHCHDATTDLEGDGWHGTMAYTWFTRPVWCWLCPDDPEEPMSLLGFPGEIPRLSGPDVVSSMRWLSAGVPWRSVSSSMTLLDSHDTGRFASLTADRAAHVVGLAWLMTHPGVPTVFAGDEVGVRGIDGDRARAPFPWDETGWDHDLLSAHRALIGLRRRTDALQRGGLRYVDVGHDSITFVRETAGERVLVHLARAPHEPVALDAGDLRIEGEHHLEQLFGEHDALVAHNTLTLPGHGPAANIWRLGP